MVYDATLAIGAYPTQRPGVIYYVICFSMNRDESRGEGVANTAEKARNGRGDRI